MKPLCPICRRELLMGKNPFRPFCSDRCRMIDLDHWLAGRYRISSPEPIEPEDGQEIATQDASGKDVE